MVCALTGKAGKHWDHTYVTYTLENLTDLSKSGGLEFHVMFMQNKWFGVGGGFGFAMFDRANNPGNAINAQKLDSDMGGIGMTLDISAIFTPKIVDIGKCPLYIELMPTLRLQPMQTLYYGSVTNEGQPVKNKYGNKWVCGVLFAGVGAKVYKDIYVRFGYVGTNGQNARLKATYGNNGVPKFRSGIKHDIYLSVGFRW